nr:hypothetical protein BaRGS_014959 [Batillaria attramentaria]
MRPTGYFTMMKVPTRLAARRQTGWTGYEVLGGERENRQTGEALDSNLGVRACVRACVCACVRAYSAIGSTCS